MVGSLTPVKSEGEATYQSSNNQVGNINGKDVRPVSNGSSGTACAGVAYICHLLVTIALCVIAIAFLSSNVSGLTIAGYVLTGCALISAVINISEGSCLKIATS